MSTEALPRSMTLEGTDLGRQARFLLPGPVQVLLSGPYEGGDFLAACPALGLCCAAPSVAAALAQVKVTLTLVVVHEGRGLNAEGRRLWRLLSHPGETATMPLSPRPCLYCGVVVPLAGNGHIRRYCNASCRKRDTYQKGVHGEARRCAVCGKQFHVKRRSEPTRTCSTRCAGRLRRGPRRRTGT